MQLRYTAYADATWTLTAASSYPLPALRLA